MEETSTKQPIDLHDVLRPIKARLWLIVVCVALATALTYYHYSSQPKQYTASTKLFIGSTNPTDLLSPDSSDRETTDLAGLVDSPAVFALAAKELGVSGRTAAGLGAVTASPVTGSDYVTITAISGSAEATAELANAVANAFVYTETSTIHREAAQAIVQAQHQLSALPNTVSNSAQRGQFQETISSMQSIEALPTAGIEHVDSAYPPAAPFAPNPKKDAIFAFVIALILTVAGAYGLDRLDRRIRKLTDVETTYGYPVLAAVPRTRKPAPIENGVAVLPDQLREAFRSLRMNLELAALDRRPKTIVISSAIPREGKSTVARNLALAYREAGLNVCVVDADLRRPELAALLDVPTVPGLTDVALGDEELSGALKNVAVGVPGLRTLARLQAASGGRISTISANGGSSAGHDKGDEIGSLVVLPSGPEPVNPPVVLGSDRMRSVLAQLAEEFDLVIIDTSPLLAVSDAVPLLSAADGVLVVSRLAMTTTDAAKDLAEQIRRIPGANMIGVVVNDLHGHEATGNSHYTYGYANSRAIA